MFPFLTKFLVEFLQGHTQAIPVIALSVPGVPVFVTLPYLQFVSLYICTFNLSPLLFLVCLMLNNQLPDTLNSFLFAFSCKIELKET